MTVLHPTHEAFRVAEFGIEIHCCACLASGEHTEFDASGCEFCDRSVLLLTNGKTIRMEDPYGSEVRFRLTPKTKAKKAKANRKKKES